MSDDGLLPAERKVREQLGHLPLDFRAMWAISNVFRSFAAIRRHMEARVLADDRLSWTSFVGLWVLWVWGECDAHEFAEAVGISRPTATGVLRTLERRGWVERRRNPSDGRGIRGAVISMTDTRGQVRTAVTNPFGYYSFGSVPSGTIYVMRAAARSHTFSTRTVSVAGWLSDIDFVDGR